MKQDIPVIFVTEAPGIREAKMAYGLVQHGVPVLLLYKKILFDPTPYFSHAIRFENAQEAITIASRTNAKIIHVFSYMVDETAFGMLYTKLARVIYDPKDMYENTVPWDRTPEDYAGQRACVEMADGWCCRDLQMLNYLRVNDNPVRRPVIYYPELCWPWDVKDVQPVPEDEVHLVSAGYTHIEKINPEFLSNGLLTFAAEMASQDIHFHLFMRHHWHGGSRDPGDLSEYYDMAERFPQVHVHDTVPPDKVASAIAPYDFGISISQGILFGWEGTFEECYKNRSNEFGNSARLFDYVDGGLGTLINAEVKLSCWLFDRADVLVRADPDFMKRPRDILMAAKRSGMRKKAEQAREYFSVMRHAPRLIRFYKSLL